MTDHLFFDAFTMAGPRARKHPAQPWKLDDILAEMDHCSISGALVASSMSITYDLLTENLRLCRQLEPHPQLFPIWNVMPHQTGEFPAPAELAPMMRDHDVRAVMVNPKTNGWDPLADHTGALFGSLQEQRIPVFLARGECDSYRDLDALLKRYPELPVVVTAVRWSEQRYLLPLLDTHPNLHLTFDNFQIHYGLEYLAATGHLDQCLYGSNAPMMAMGAHRAYVDYADIPDAAKAKIAGGNLIRLLKGQQPPRNHVNADEDELMRAARHGQPLPIPVIDMHMHILDDGLDCAGGAYRMQRGGPEGVFPLLDRMGVKGGGFMSWNGTVGADSVNGNVCVKGVLDQAPPGYFGLGTFDPTHYSQEELRRQIPELYADPRFVGMKPYVMYGVEYHHPSYDLWWEFGNQRGYYALIHRTRGDYLEVDTLAARYPNVRWVVAHCGANYPTADGVIDAIRKNPNVYAEITLTPVTCGIIDYLAEHGGADRIVYGSDLPMRDPRQQFGWVVFSRLSVEDKRKILYTNALDILKPCWNQLPERNRPPLP